MRTVLVLFTHLTSEAPRPAAYTAASVGAAPSNHAHLAHLLLVSIQVFAVQMGAWMQGWQLPVGTPRPLAPQQQGPKQRTRVHWSGSLACSTVGAGWRRRRAGRAPSSQVQCVYLSMVSVWL